MFESGRNSNAAKLGYTKPKINKPQITPYNSFGSSGANETITLPPIMQSAGGTKSRASGYGGGTLIPAFSHTFGGSDALTIASIYGIE
jgi:hypothetical protein